MLLSGIVTDREESTSTFSVMSSLTDTMSECSETRLGLVQPLQPERLPLLSCPSINKASVCSLSDSLYSATPVSNGHVPLPQLPVEPGPNLAAPVAG